MAYATSTDLAAFMQQDVDIGVATLTLELVAAAMDEQMGADPDNYAPGSVTVGGDTFTGAALSSAFTDVLLDGPPQGSSILLLPRYPVTAVADVQVQDTLGTWTELVYQRDYVWSRDGVLTRIRAGIPSAIGPAQFPGPPLSAIEYMRMEPIWPSLPQGVKATFTAGLTTVPVSLKTVNLSAAARVYANPTGVVGESIGGYSVRYSPRADGGIGGLSFNSLEIDMLGRFKTVMTA
ncbi:MAG: hypothetical protein ACRDVE_15660 [Actinocrinis sp.]